MKREFDLVIETNNDKGTYNVSMTDVQTSIKYELKDILYDPYELPDIGTKLALEIMSWASIMFDEKEFEETT